MLDLNRYRVHEGAHAIFEQSVALVRGKYRDSVAGAVGEADFKQKDVVALFLEVVVGFVASSRHLGVELEVFRRKVFKRQVQSIILGKHALLVFFFRRLSS